MRKAISAGFVAVLSTLMFGQQVPTLRVDTTLVTTTVTVRDRAGKPIEGLRARDFSVTEDNEPQDIAFVEYHRLDNTIALPRAVATTTIETDSGTPSLFEGRIAIPPPGDTRFQDRRLIVLFFDLSAPPNADQDRMFSGAAKYVEESMSATDVVAIMSYSEGAVRVKQDFTADRQKLRSVIDVLAHGEDRNGDGVPDFEDFSSAFGQNDAEFNIFSTDRKLAALQTAVTTLRPLPEQKSLVFFTSQLVLSGTDNSAQMRATTNAAIRANVQIFPVDARGLVARAPLGDANRRSPGGIGMFTGAIAQQAMNSFQRSQDTLFALAKDTGGKAFVNYNDLSLGVQQAADAQVSYYVVGFYSKHTAKDGRFHRVQVRLANSTLQADLSYRQGYYADKEWARMSGVDRERQLEEAMMLENPITEIPIALEVNYFQLNRAEYFVPVAVIIPGSELDSARRRGSPRLRLDVLVEIKDDHGATQRNMRDKIEKSLSSSDAEQVVLRPIQYDTGFTLLPGKYVIKFLVRDAEAGRTGTYETAFTIPNLNHETARLPISSVVLAGQQQSVNEAVYSVKTTDKESVGHLLIEGGRKLLPSVTRVFRSSREIYVYVEAYEQYADILQPLVAAATFYRNGKRVYQPKAVTVRSGMDRTSHAIPIRLSLPTTGLSPGVYDLNLTIVEPASSKAAFWQSTIAIQR